MQKLDFAAVITVYFLISVAILSTAKYCGEGVAVLFSILLLIPLYFWQKFYRRSEKLAEDLTVMGGNPLIFVFGLFFLALMVRIPSVLMFNYPYEKVPLIYLVVLQILLVEKLDISLFGFKSEKLEKSLVIGVIYFSILYIPFFLLTFLFIYIYSGVFFVQGYDIWLFLLSFPVMTLCVGVSEEGLFRGYMQTHLQRRWSVWNAILFQALLFGVWHFVWHVSPIDLAGMFFHVLFAFAIGISFGFFYSKFKNLVPLVVAHGLWDSLPAGLIQNPKLEAIFTQFPAEINIIVWGVPFTASLLLSIAFIKIFVSEN